MVLSTCLLLRCYVCCYVRGQFQVEIGLGCYINPRFCTSFWHRHQVLHHFDVQYPSFNTVDDSEILQQLM